MAFLPFALVGILLIYLYADESFFYWLSPSPEEHLSPWLNINWLLFRSLFGLALFYGLSALYVVKGLRPDLASAKNDNIDCSIRALLVDLCWIGGPPGRIGASLFYW